MAVIVGGGLDVDVVDAVFVGPGVSDGEEAVVSLSPGESSAAPPVHAAAVSTTAISRRKLGEFVVRMSGSTSEPELVAHGLRNGLSLTAKAT